MNTSVCTFSGRARRAVRARLHTCADVPCVHICTRVRWRENTGDADARGVCCVCAAEVVSLTSSSPEDAGAAQG